MNNSIDIKNILFDGWNDKGYNNKYIVLLVINENLKFQFYKK